MSNVIRQIEESQFEGETKETETGVKILLKESDLPICSDETKGHSYYIELDEGFQFCNGTLWGDIDLQGEDGVGEVGTSNYDD